MEKGYLVQATKISIWSQGEGVYWSKSEFGVAGSREAVVAYACSQCGFIEAFLRRFEERSQV